MSPWEKERLKKKYSVESDFGGHFHAHTLGLLSVLDYAVVAGDRELLEFVKSGFEWGRTQGSSLVGFFPEFLVPQYPSCETCEVADMLGLATKLSAAGVGDYWDDIERWTRNHFAEAQLTSPDWVYRMASRQPSKPVEPNESTDRVAERNLGSFAGWAAANDWVIQGFGIMHCCTGNATRALYYIWQNIVEHKDGRLKVNLLLNRASAWADVYSYIPYEGRVDLKMKKECEQVLVRAPEWVSTRSKQLTCRVNDAPRQPRWDGRYVNLGSAKPGDKFAITFPIEQRTVKETIGAAPYTLAIKGTTVVSIDPPGENGPLYQRAAYTENQAPMRQVRRFVPDQTLLW